MSEADQPMTSGPPPYRDYLADGVTRSAALDMCDHVVRDTPEVAPAYLSWLIRELRTSGWTDPPTPIL